MSEAASAGPIACPFCDAEARPGAKYCWLCGAKMEAAQPALPARADIVILPEEVGNWQPASATKSPKPAPFQFGISTLLVILTLAAVLLGVWKMAPGLGAVLTVVAALGLIGLAGVSSAEAKRQSQTAEMRREIQRAGVSRAGKPRGAAYERRKGRGLHAAGGHHARQRMDRHIDDRRGRAGNGRCGDHRHPADLLGHVFAAAAQSIDVAAARPARSRRQRCGPAE